MKNSKSNHARFSSMQSYRLKLFSTVALLLVSIFLFSCDNAASRKSAIERVLQEDSHTNDNQPTTADVIMRMKKIDLAGCPQEFKEAYIEHIIAWEKREYVERKILALKNEIDSVKSTINAKMDNNSDYQAAVFLRALNGDYAGAARDDMAIRQAVLKPYINRVLKLQTELEEALGELRNSFEKVKKIAIKYDAKLP